jgi:small subunit ribosomal protein S1
VADYGAFVELENGVEGLVHVSEMSWSKRVKHPSKVVNPGDLVESRYSASIQRHVGSALA